MEKEIIPTEKYLAQLEFKQNELTDLIATRKAFYLEVSEYELSARLRDCENELLKVFKELKSFNDPYDLIAIKLSTKS